MRFIHLYPDRLLRPRPRRGAGAVAGRRSRPRRAASWIAIGAIIVVGLGIMLAVTSGKPTRSPANKQLRSADAARCPITACASQPVAVPAGTSYGSVMRSHASTRPSCSPLSSCALSAACKEDGTITVHSLSFKGVKAVDEGAPEGRARDASELEDPVGQEVLTSTARASMPT